MPIQNPLLDSLSPGTLPRFDAILPAHVAPAISVLLEKAKTLIDHFSQTKAPPTWANFVAPLFDGLEPLSRAWGMVGHLHSVCDTPDWRAAYNELLPSVTRFYTALGQNPAMFARYKTILESPEYAHLSADKQQVIRHAVRDFRLSGAELPEKDKPRFQAISEEIAALSAKFSENLLDATNAFIYHTEEVSELAGLPEDTLSAAKEAAEKAGQKGFRFSLHAPSYLPILQFAQNRTLRETFYRAHLTRASEFSEAGSLPQWDNTPIMRSLLALKQEEAMLLGFPHFGDLSLASKMASSTQEVFDFLKELAKKARPFGQKDVAELKDFAKTHLGLPQLEAWDVAYASEALRRERYAFSEEEVKAYFTEEKVIAGLFSVIARLFGVQVKPEPAPVWQEDVRFYRLENKEGVLIGQFYLDLYARQSKRGGAWMDEARARKGTQSGIQTPIAYLNCNFSRPVAGKSATFSHDDVITLFHEMGHGLHHLLTAQTELGVSGISGVAWDAVELPSQFMENYCWEYEVLKGMSAHVDTGEPLPRALFDKMTNARHFQSGLFMLRQIEFALFDMRLHTDFEPSAHKTVMDVLREVKAEVALLPTPDWARFPNGFSHIFGGGYAAGYYSYKWAEVLSSDVYAAFEEAYDPFDARTAARYVSEILSQGGAKNPMDAFIAFRGRAPSVDALLRHQGMGA